MFNENVYVGFGWGQTIISFVHVDARSAVQRSLNVPSAQIEVAYS